MTPRKSVRVATCDVDVSRVVDVPIATKNDLDEIETDTAQLKQNA